MALQSVKLDKAEKTLTIVMDLEEPKESGSGKTMVIASTRGNAKSGTKFKDKEIVVGVNAYFKP